MQTPRVHERLRSSMEIRVRCPSWNPFSAKQALLLDLSLGGFGLEFCQKTRLQVGANVLLLLSPWSFGLAGSSTLSLGAQVVWFDERACRCGGRLLLESGEKRVRLQEALDQLGSMQPRVAKAS